MLDLDSGRWTELVDAYGRADRVPALLRQLPSAPTRAGFEAQPWFDLWSRLCHQGDVYTASYAALPHIVACAALRAPSIQAEFLVLAGSIETSRRRARAPEVPTDLAEAYDRALSECLRLALDAIAVEDDDDWVRGLLATIAALRGQPQVAAALSALEPTTACPECGAEFPTPGFDEY